MNSGNVEVGMNLIMILDHKFLGNFLVYDFLKLKSLFNY